jgi:hypothetical protein
MSGTPNKGEYLSPYKRKKYGIQEPDLKESFIPNLSPKKSTHN